MQKNKILFLISFLVISFYTYSTIFAQTSREEDIKAVFIYNFTRYIRWSNFDSTDFFKIGIYGDSEIIEPLQKIAEKKRVNNKSILVKQFSDTSVSEDCDIIVLSNSSRNDARDIIKRITKKNVLVIGESEGFVELGAAIDFVNRDSSLKFEINQKVIKQSGLIVSSQLLKLALLVE